jgi:hypothetical protein
MNDQRRQKGAGVMPAPRPPKRGYSRAFTPRGDSGKRYLLDEIPAGLWKDVKAKSKRSGVSIRARLLAHLTAWVAEP